MTIMEALVYSPVAIVLATLLIGFLMALAARAWTAHRMERAERESDKIDRLALETAPYAAYEVEFGEFEDPPGWPMRLNRGPRSRQMIEAARRAEQDWFGLVNDPMAVSSPSILAGSAEDIAKRQK